MASQFKTRLASLLALLLCLQQSLSSQGTLIKLRSRFRRLSSGLLHFFSIQKLQRVLLSLAALLFSNLQCSGPRSLLIYSTRQNVGKPTMVVIRRESHLPSKTHAASNDQKVFFELATSPRWCLLNAGVIDETTCKDDHGNSGGDSDGRLRKCSTWQIS